MERPTVHTTSAPGPNTSGPAIGFENAEELARQLIRHLGVAGARRTCVENHWDGVLNLIKAQGNLQ